MSVRNTCDAREKRGLGKRRSFRQINREDEEDNVDLKRREYEEENRPLLTSIMFHPRIEDASDITKQAKIQARHPCFVRAAFRLPVLPEYACFPSSGASIVLCFISDVLVFLLYFCSCFFVVLLTYVLLCSRTRYAGISPA